MNAPVSWIERTAVACWPASRIESISALKGDASSRCFWRVSFAPRASDAPRSVIAIDLGPDDLPLYARALALVTDPLSEPPWLTMQRYLTTIGSPVPTLFASDTQERLLLVEDVGELPLAEAAQRGDAADLYRLAADELLRIHLDGTKHLSRDCIASRIAYNRALFRWELAQFLELAPDIIGGSTTSALQTDLDNLAERLDRLPRVLSHRDYHGHNLFLQYDTDHNCRLRIIDFQDALTAPAAQDLAVLLTTRNTSEWIPERIEQRVLEYYYAALIRRGEAALSMREFLESYSLCVLQHALKVIGRFTYLEKTGKVGYSQYIPYALAQARRILARIDDFPQLRRALQQ